LPTPCTPCYSCKALQQINFSVATCIVCNEEQRKHCSIPVFKFSQVHSWSHTLSCWQMKAVQYSTWSWQFVSNWGKVPLVYGIKCHPTSVVQASAALLCLSISVVLQYHHRLVSLVLRPGLTTEVITVVTMKITVLWDVTLGDLIDIHVCFGGMCYLHLRTQKVSYLCPCDCFQTQFKLPIVYWHD
jgi:hypothetical protein